jgi:hypothetical protein
MLGAEVAHFWDMPLSAAGRSASILCEASGSIWVLKMLIFWHGRLSSAGRLASFASTAFCSV